MLLGCRICFHGNPQVVSLNRFNNSGLTSSLFTSVQCKSKERGGGGKGHYCVASCIKFLLQGENQQIISSLKKKYFHSLSGIFRRDSWGTEACCSVSVTPKGKSSSGSWIADLLCVCPGHKFTPVCKCAKNKRHWLHISTETGCPGRLFKRCPERPHRESLDGNNVLQTVIPHPRIINYLLKFTSKSGILKDSLSLTQINNTKCHTNNILGYN